MYVWQEESEVQGQEDGGDGEEVHKENEEVEGATVVQEPNDDDEEESAGALYHFLYSLGFLGIKSPQLCGVCDL